MLFIKVPSERVLSRLEQFEDEEKKSGVNRKFFPFFFKKKKKKGFRQHNIMVPAPIPIYLSACDSTGHGSPR